MSPSNMPTGILDSAGIIFFAPALHSTAELQRGAVCFALAVRLRIRGRLLIFQLA